jgi:hypothetical protein
MNDNLHLFVRETQKHFDARQNGLLYCSINNAYKYYSILAIIKRRYLFISKKLSAQYEQLNKMFMGVDGPLSNVQDSCLNKCKNLCEIAQLDIESYYVFSKILLDKLAHFIELYFIPVRGLSLDSHDQFTKNFEALCKRLNLCNVDKLKSIIILLKSDISDFRDYQIVHEKCPRTIRSFGVETCVKTKKQATMMLTRLYPKESDTQIHSRRILELDGIISAYINEITNFLRMNLDKSRGKL